MTEVTRESTSSVVVPGIGNAVHRVVWYEINRSPLWKQDRLEIRAACGMRVLLAGSLHRPQVGTVTCEFCLEDAS